MSYNNSNFQLNFKSLLNLFYPQNNQVVAGQKDIPEAFLSLEQPLVA